MSPPAADPPVTVTDPDGRPVVLRPHRWDHILTRHPELAGLRTQVLQAVETPTRRLPGRALNERWYYLELDPPQPSRWLKAVVHYNSSGGSISTAFARRALP